MTSLRLAFIPLGLVLLLFVPSPAQQTSPSFSKDIKPFLAKYCYECHQGAKPKAGLDVTTYKKWLDGGISFPGFVPGKPNESFSVTLVEGKSKPVMPPKGKPQPTDAEKKMLRDWIAAGAKDDSGATKTSLPEIKPKNAVAPPVTALAYVSNMKWLLAGANKDVFLIEADKFPSLNGRLGDFSGRVTALAAGYDGAVNSPQSLRIAVATGTSGAAGEVRIYRGESRPDWPPPKHVIAAHSDLIHDIAFSPGGKILATTGYDRLIKLWDVETGKELRTLKDHSDSVYGIAFSPDGKLLASAAADRAVKVWDVATGKRLYTLSDATDWVYAVAWSPDGKHLAAAGVDRSIRVWEANAEGGKLVHSAFAHEGPVLRLVYSTDGKTLYSLSEDRTVKSWDTSKLSEKKVYPRQPEAVLSLAVSPDGKQIALGRYDGALVILDEATGEQLGQPLPTKPKQPGDRFDPVEKKPHNNTPPTAQRVMLPVTIVGTLDRGGAVDFYSFPAKAGQEIGVHAVPADAKTFEPILQLTDLAGKVLAQGNDLLGHRCVEEGIYTLSIRDRDYRGGKLDYRLHIGDIPIVTSIFPLGVTRGSETEVAVSGVNLGDVRSVKLNVPADAAVGSRLPLNIKTMQGAPLGSASVVVGEFPSVRTGRIPVPGTGDGVILAPGPKKPDTTQTWQFSAKKGQQLIVEVKARRIGSPLDSVIEILDIQDRPVPLATLRATAKTFTSLRDIDSNSPGIRLETWNEFAVNDFVMIDSELLRIKTLPKNPDDDCQFVAVNGSRVGQLGTTPSFHVFASTVYKVTLHPPGTTFPPNGFPVVTLYYRNDDGGPGYGKDSRLFFDPPADGEYRVRIGDARGQGGDNYAYRLTVRPPRPSYQVRFNPTTPAVWKGGAVPITVTADRLDGFDDAIDVRLTNLPPGFSAPATTIPVGETSTVFALFAETGAELPDKAMPLQLIARAKIGEQEIVREVAGGKPTLVEPGDIVTTLAQEEVSVRPGQTVKLTVNIERRNKFAGRVPLDVRGLPHGVRVLDIGLNGILITEQVSSRTIEIYCEPWVTPTEHPFVVLARREGKNTEHAAKSVLLKVVK
jgi:hypothetical protein